MKKTNGHLSPIALLTTEADVKMLCQILHLLQPTTLQLSVVVIGEQAIISLVQQYLLQQTYFNHFHIGNPNSYTLFPQTVYTIAPSLQVHSLSNGQMQVYAITNTQLPTCLCHLNPLLQANSSLTLVFSGIISNKHQFNPAKVPITPSTSAVWIQSNSTVNHYCPFAQMPSFPSAETLIEWLQQQDLNMGAAVNRRLDLPEEKLKILVENSYEGISLRSHDWQLIYRSPSAEKITGWNFEEVLHAAPNQHIHPDDVANYQSIIQQAIEQPATPFIAIYRVRHKKGHYMWLETIITNMLHDTNIAAYVFNYRDISNRKQVEIALQYSQQQYKSLFDHNPAAVFSVNLDGYFTAANAVLAIKAETDIDNILQQHFAVFIHPNDLQNAYQYFEAAKQGLQTDTELRVVTAKKNIVHTHLVVLPITVNNQIVGVYGIANDITDKKIAETDLRISNERFNYVTKATFDAIWDWNTQNHELYWGEGFNTLFGYKGVNGIVKADAWKSKLHPEDQQLVLNSLKQTLSTPTAQIWDSEYRFLKADGAYAVVHDRGIIIRNTEGRAIRMIGAMQDVTQKKQEEERLKLLESVIINTNDGILITEAEPFEEPHPKIVYVNNAFCAMTGYNREEIIGRTPRMFQGPKSDRKQLDKLSKALKNWQPCEIELVNYKKSGEEYWIHFSVVPVANEKGWYTHWIAIERDITARKRAEEERKQLIQELTNNNKELKQFSYITSHNMRSPVTNLLAVFSLLDTSTIQNEETLMLIEAMKTSTLHLNETLNDLISILIIKENTNQQLQHISFNHALQKVISSINSFIYTSKANIHANFSRAATVYFNQGYLESIFLNLITNAIKYAHPQRIPEINIHTNTDAQYEYLYIKDNGIGMNLEKIGSKIFGLYQRFHNHPDSKGIGLYLVHSQITALGGSIDVQSVENEGTTFIIKFKKN